MPAPSTTRAKKHQEQWQEIARDPNLRDLPYKVETNSRGQIVLSPHRNRHSFLREEIQDLLDEHAPDGRYPPEFAVATARGIKSPDVVWMSPERWREMETTGDPTTLAPEICIEVLSSSNTKEEIREKRELYFETGAEEVWVVTEAEQIRFFEEEEMEHSELVPSFPDQL